MRISRATYAVSVAALALCAGGCGVPFGHVRIPLEESPLKTVDVSRITVEDLRAPEAIGNRSGDFVSCERWYGDAIFVPDKLTYLKRMLAARLPAGAEAHIKLTAFDTIENCAPADTAAVSNSVGAVTGMYLDPAGGPLSGRMQVQLEGEINGKPFKAIRWFSHSDLDRRTTALDRNPMYHERLRAVLDRCADQVVAVAFPAAKAD